jgi:hypothetical protein
MCVAVDVVKGFFGRVEVMVVPPHLLLGGDRQLQRVDPQTISCGVCHWQSPQCLAGLEDGASCCRVGEPHQAGS